VKFYTEEGNWDVVATTRRSLLPRSAALLGPQPRDQARSAHRPALGRQPTGFWSLLPEALHQVTIVMSDRGIPKSFRHMHGFGSHTFSMIDAADQRVWVKFHFRSQQGIENLTTRMPPRSSPTIARATGASLRGDRSRPISRNGRCRSR